MFTLKVKILKEYILAFLEWLQIYWPTVVFILAVIEGVREIATNTGVFGRWVQRKINGNLEQRVISFMDEHQGCKPRTEKRLKEIEDSINRIEKRIRKQEILSQRDWESWKLQFRIDDNILEHVKHGNHFQQCSDVKDELHQHLLNNR